MLRPIRLQYLLMLFVIVTIALYYGSLSLVLENRDILSLDDGRLMNYLFEHRLQLSEVFNPAWQGKYYRPFVDLTYLIDQTLWGDEPFGYRLTNVLIHAVNALLIYLLSRLFFKNENYGHEIGFWAALLFIVHPIAVESISWISGRTDPLATFWSLLAILFYLTGNNRQSWYFYPFSLLFIGIALLSKETALVTPIIIVLWEIFYGPRFTYARWKYSLVLFLGLLFAIPLYFKLRSGMTFGGDIGLALLKDQLSGGAFAHNAKLFCTSYGFYLKKFFYPFPLNLAIHQIHSSLYAILGLIAILGVFFTLPIKRFRKHHFFYLWAMGGIGPAALVSLTNVAWTNWAERYLYFSLVPLSFLMVMTIYSFLDQCNASFKRFFKVLFFLPLLFFALSSYQRSAMMSDSEATWKDSYQKSPAFMGTVIGYANILATNDKLLEAELVLNEGRKLAGGKHLLFFNLGHISRKKGDNDKADIYYNTALTEAKNDPKLVTVGMTLRKDILSSMGDLELERARLADDGNVKRAHYLKAIDNFKRGNAESPDPFLLYRTAKLYLRLGEKEKAAHFFKLFINRWHDDHYREAAKKMLYKIDQE